MFRKLSLVMLFTVFFVASLQAQSLDSLLSGFNTDFRRAQTEADRIAVVNRLAGRTEPEAVDKLQWAFKKERQFAGVKRAILAALGRAGTPEAVEAIWDAFGDRDPEVTAGASAALGTVTNPKGLAFLMEKGMSQRDMTIRAQTVAILAARNPKEYVAQFRKAVDDREWWVRSEGYKGFGETGDTSLIPEVRKGLEDRDPRVVASAAAALGKLKDTESVSRIKGLFDSEDWRTRIAAVEALALIGTPEAGEALAERWKNAEGREFGEILTAMKEIAGRDLGEKPETWSMFFHRQSLGGERAQGEWGEEVVTGIKASTKFYGLETFSKRIIYVVDKTGSMQGEKIETLKRELWDSIQSLSSSTSYDKKPGYFTIISFDTAFTVWKDELVEANERNLRDAKRFIDGLNASGRTNIYDPMVQALSMAHGISKRVRKVDLETYAETYEEENKGDTIFLMSDGSPNEGSITDPAAIVEELTRQNRLVGAVINTINIQGNAQLMGELARRNGGESVSR